MMNTTDVIAVQRMDSISDDERERIIRRSGANDADVVSSARPIIEDVRREGDSAVRRYTEQHDGVHLESLVVTEEEFEEAEAQVEEPVKAALRVAYSNIMRFHQSQLQPQPVVENGAGVRVWREWRSVERVGLYIPGGSTMYPSSVLMNAVPARVAGCTQVAISTPPGRDGKIPAPALVAARQAGISTVYKVGGAQAIAALAYGTESIQRVYKVFGAGNAYVTAAKMLVFGDVDIDLPAGPSEILIIADDSTDPTALAWDLMAQSEHRHDSASVLVTDSQRLAGSVAAELDRLVPTVASSDKIIASFRAYGAILVTDTIEQAAAFANEYAPEHLQIATRDPHDVLGLINNAGSVFLGPFTPVPCGDYATGSNHVLPTGGNARTFGPLSVEAFGRWLQVQQLSREGLERIASTVTTLATVERLPAHSETVKVRLDS